MLKFVIVLNNTILYFFVQTSLLLLSSERKKFKIKCCSITSFFIRTYVYAVQNFLCKPELHDNWMRSICRQLYKYDGNKPVYLVLIQE